MGLFGENKYCFLFYKSSFFAGRIAEGKDNHLQ